MSRPRKARSPIAKRLKEARLAAGFSQRQLGVRLGYETTTSGVRINQYERAVHEPNFTFVKRVSSVLGKPTAYFYAEDSDLAELIAAYGSLAATDRRKLVAMALRAAG